jgi:sugar phosphate isomerase/epimerase
MLTRRKFMEQSAILSAGLMMQSFMPPSKQRFGIQLYTCRNDVAKDLAATLNYIAAAGYEDIELFGYNEGMFFGKTPADFRKMFDALKLSAPSGHYYIPKFMYEGQMDEWKKAIDAAVAMGNQYMVIPWMDADHRKGDDFKKLVDYMNKAGELTKAAGMQLAYHNHDFEFAKGDDGVIFYDMMVKGLDKKLVQLEMDLYWVVFAGENPLTWFKKYPGRFPLWHVKDMHLNDKGEKESIQVGDGTIDFKSIFAQRALSGLKYGFVEQEAYSMPEETCIKKSIDFMKKKNWGNNIVLPTKKATKKK